MSAPWFVRGRRKYVAGILLAADLSVGFWSGAMALTTSAPTASTGIAGTPTSGVSQTTASAATIDWSAGRTLDPADKNQPLFSNLQVTVSQTKDLTDQGVLVSWVGGKETQGSGAPADYLQIMQCWGSAGAAAPTPQQCQWGTPNPTLGGQTGLTASTRDLLVGAIRDPQQFPNGICTAEFTHQQFGMDPTCSVPFWSADDPTKSNLGWAGDSYHQPPFNPAQSNEVTYARTGADGTGQYIFNLQSALTSPYLGCGDAAMQKAGKTCWLVVVPRGEFDPNGDFAATQDPGSGYDPNYYMVAGSPLSRQMWNNRIQFKLGFTPIGASCKLGASSYLTAGTEFIAGAFASWQSTLCDRGTTFGYSRITDPQARLAAVPGGGPVMEYVANPADPSVAGSARLVYAPVANSAIVVSYFIDKNYQRPTASNPNPDYRSNGSMVQDLRLTPLIVAKLLTQSYRSDTPGDGHVPGSTVPADNPYSLLQDEDFLALNPNFRFFNATQIPDGLIVPFGNSDAAKQVWAWLRSDSATRRFLSGEKVDGATINAAYQKLNLATDTSIDFFPKNDQTSFLGPDWPKPGYGTLDMRPYAANFADGAAKVVAANSGKKTVYDPTLSPPQATGSGTQSPGNRFMLALTTSAAASLYGLPTAGLVPDAGSTTAGAHATAQSIAAEIAGATVGTSVSGVMGIDPGVPVAGGYPLALRTYAVVNLCATPLDALKADASFLDYAAAGGQTPGTQVGELPPGYSPLATADRALTKTAAATIRAEVAAPQCQEHKAAPTPTATPSATPTDTPAGSGDGGSLGSGGSPVTPPTTVPQGAAPVATAGDALPGGITPAAWISPAGRYGLLSALCFFVPCVIAGPTVLSMSRRMS